MGLSFQLQRPRQGLFSYSRQQRHSHRASSTRVPAPTQHALSSSPRRASALHRQSGARFGLASNTDQYSLAQHLHAILSYTLHSLIPPLLLATLTIAATVIFLFSAYLDAAVPVRFIIGIAGALAGLAVLSLLIAGLKYGLDLRCVGTTVGTTDRGRRRLSYLDRLSTIRAGRLSRPGAEDEEWGNIRKDSRRKATAAKRHAFDLDGSADEAALPGAGVLLHVANPNLDTRGIPILPSSSGGYTTPSSVHQQPQHHHHHHYHRIESPLRSQSSASAKKLMKKADERAAELSGQRSASTSRDTSPLTPTSEQAPVLPPIERLYRDRPFGSHLKREMHDFENARRALYGLPTIDGGRTPVPKRCEEAYPARRGSVVLRGGPARPVRRDTLLVPRKPSVMSTTVSVPSKAFSKNSPPYSLRPGGRSSTVPEPVPTAESIKRPTRFDFGPVKRPSANLQGLEQSEPSRVAAGVDDKRDPTTQKPATPIGMPKIEESLPIHDVVSLTMTLDQLQVAPLQIRSR